MGAMHPVITSAGQLMDVFVRQLEADVAPWFVLFVCEAVALRFVRIAWVSLTRRWRRSWR